LTDFKSLGLSEALLKTLAAEGYTTPTPIQAQAIPHLLKGRDLLGIAQTGTGKTAAFALPILQKLAGERRPPQRAIARALILSPTRELASQIGESFRTYGRGLNMKIAVAFGGVGYKPQTDALFRGLDVLVATPGRLIDHMENGALNVSLTEIVVLDEADQMLDLGFIHPIRRIVKALPHKRQSLFFSATMPKAMNEIAAELLRDPVRVEVTPVAKTADRVEQRVILIETPRKRSLLTELLKAEDMGRTLVFTRTKHGADRIIKQLEHDGIAAAAIHGNKSQGQREKALAGFKSGATPILVATDIAARGIDVEGVAHVINFDLPNVPEQYVHRIGRTARAGAAGIAISFCDNEERAYLRDIERLTRQSIPMEDRRHEKTDDRPARPASAYKNPRPQQQRFAERHQKPRGEGGFKRRDDGFKRREDGGERLVSNAPERSSRDFKAHTPKPEQPARPVQAREPRVNERAFAAGEAKSEARRERPKKPWAPQTDGVIPTPPAEARKSSSRPDTRGARRQNEPRTFSDTPRKPFAKPERARDDRPRKPQEGRPQRAFHGDKPAAPRADRPERTGRPERRSERDVSGGAFLRKPGGKPRADGPRTDRPQGRRANGR
jgi:ATP-dependent RNA helicase RhlE